ncbi:MAG TPA: succinylglutamate desuccinylase/aspartoacylase family protein [Thermoguttaceae bacterium]|nr:succinylglutamate desuccinylase/aspartoacylase family protein [Thermoguttaceae bacterium]
MEASSLKPGPVVWLTACGHGDEVGGIVVVQEVFRRLRKRPLSNGELRAFPLMNPLGFEAAARLVTISQEDLNRSFPGTPNGTLAERIAAKVFQSIVETSPTIVLDLHNDWIRSIPYTVLDSVPQGPVSELCRRTATLAAATGFPVVLEQESIRASLSHSLMQHGIPALTVELGESYVVNEKNVELGVRSVFNILAELGMIEPDDEPFGFPLPAEVMGKPLRYSNQPLSSTSGILRFMTRPGAVVRAGQSLAKVVNAFGRHLETLTTAHDAFVLGHTDSSVAYPGAPVVALGVLSEKKVSGASLTRP